MNHSECPGNPFMCALSVFLEDMGNADGKSKRWVECSDYYYAEDPNTKKMTKYEREKFILIRDGAEIEIRQGALCISNSSDWLEKAE
jgi:hypothetical protein